MSRNFLKQGIKKSDAADGVFFNDADELIKSKTFRFFFLSVVSIFKPCEYFSAGELRC